MAKSPKTVQPKDQRKIDVLLAKYAESHQHPTNKLIHWICVPLIVFSLLALIWSIPFPHLDFLGRYNGFVNWASFLIAISVYYYYTLSPVMSYLMLISIVIMSFFIVSLEKWELSGGPAMWHVALVIFILAWIGQFIGHKLEGKKPSFFEDVKFLLIGPIWLFYFICQKIGLRY